MKYWIAILGISAIAAFGQSKPDKPAKVGTSDLTGWVTVPAALSRESAEWQDRITKDGHYVATFDDPNNEYRCDVVSYLDANAHNVLYSDITSVTIICTKKREPKHD